MRFAGSAWCGSKPKQRCRSADFGQGSPHQNMARSLLRMPPILRRTRTAAVNREQCETVRRCACAKRLGCAHDLMFVASHHTRRKQFFGYDGLAREKEALDASAELCPRWLPPEEQRNDEEVAADWELPLLIRGLLGADAADSGCRTGACARQGEGEGDEGAGRRGRGEAAARARIGAIEQWSAEATTVQTRLRLRGPRPPHAHG